MKVFEDSGGRVVQRLWSPLNVADYGAKLRAAATEHMTMLEQTPQRVKKYFGDPKVAYAAS